MEIMMNDRERIGKKLAEIRSEKGYTVRQLAELADLRPATISNVENGNFGSKNRNCKGIAQFQCR